jgi:bacterioferritin
MDKKKIVELLNLDLQDEHGAIIQYLSHAYAMGEGEVSCEIEAVARDEMRHLDWLAETIVELGGTPSVKRGSMRLGGEAVPDWMGNDVLLEGDAIHNYEEHIKMIDDPKIKRLLQRILADERAHQGKFRHFVDKTAREGLKDVRGDRKDAVTKDLDWGIQHEYTVILQYLVHSYLSPNEEAKKQLEDQAINEMQHLGWLAEELVDGGGSPMIQPAEIELPASPVDMLKADIKIEKEVYEKYDRMAAELKDEDLKALIMRIRDNEKYHIDVFSDALKQEEKG